MNKKIILFVLIILFLIVLIPNFALSQGIQFSNSLNDVNKSNAKEVLKLQIPNLFQKFEYEVLFKGDKAIIKFYDKFSEVSSLCVVDLTNRRIVSSMNYVYQIEDTNSSAFMLVAILMKDDDVLSSSTTRLNVSFSLPSDEDINNYKINIIKINMLTGNNEILIRDAKSILSKTITPVGSPFVKKKPLFFDYIPELNMFSYKIRNDIMLFDLNNNTANPINITKFTPTYLGNIPNLGNIAILNNATKELYIYDISYEKLYIVGKNVVIFDIVNNVESQYYFPIPESKAFMFLTREDTNKDGIINKFDKSRLYISYVDTKRKHLIKEDFIDRFNYYPLSKHISLLMRDDSNGDKIINDKDNAFRVYLYDIVNKQRIFISRNGYVVDFIRELNIFLFHSFDKNTNNDKIIDVNDEPTSYVYSIVNKKIYNVNSSKLISFKVFNNNSFVYHTADSTLYIYNIKDETNTLLAKNMFIEKFLPDINKIILRKSSSKTVSKEPSSADLFIYDVNIKTLLSLGKEYVNLNDFKQKSMATNEISYCEFVDKKNVLIMIQRASIIGPNGEEELTNFFNFVVYKIDNKIKEIPFQGDIHDFSYTGRYGQIMVTVRPESKINFDTYLIDADTLKVSLLGIVASVVEIVDNKYLILISPDNNNALYVFDTEELKISTIIDNVVPFTYPEKQMSYKVNDYVFFVIKGEGKDKVIYYIKPMEELKKIGSFNGEYYFNDYLDSYVLVSYRSDNQVIDIRIYSTVL